MQQTAEQKIYYILRFAMAMCFIGHGAFGIITKEIWCNYFAVFGIGHTEAYQLMPPLGVVDILMGISILLYPVRAIVAWLCVWGLITAALRPVSGEPFAEFIERAGNYGVPFVMLLMTASRGSIFNRPFALLNAPASVDPKIMGQVTLCLRIIVFLLLAGHGWLNLIEKKSLLAQYESLGIGNPSSVAHVVGSFELIAACLVLIKPDPRVLLVLFVWKIVSELFYPHYEVFEWIERGGSYGSILALYFAARHVSPRRINNAIADYSRFLSKSPGTT